MRTDATTEMCMCVLVCVGVHPFNPFFPSIYPCLFSFLLLSSFLFSAPLLPLLFSVLPSPFSHIKVLAHSLNREEIKQLRDVFNTIDTENSGYVLLNKNDYDKSFDKIWKKMKLVDIENLIFFHPISFSFSPLSSSPLPFFLPLLLPLLTTV